MRSDALRRQSSRWCRYCGAYTLHERERFEPAVGCLLTVLSLGLFLPVWILCQAFDWGSPNRCQVCGGKHRRSSWSQGPRKPRPGR
jgi:hypothetical protein